MITMLKDYCELYLLLKEKSQLLHLLLMHDLDNIDLQVQLLKTYYELKDCKKRMRSVLRNEN